MMPELFTFCKVNDLYTESAYISVSCMKFSGLNPFNENNLMRNYCELFLLEFLYLQKLPSSIAISDET